MNGSLSCQQLVTFAMLTSLSSSIFEMQGTDRNALLTCVGTENQEVPKGNVPLPLSKQGLPFPEKRRAHHEIRLRNPMGFLLLLALYPSTQQ